MKEKLKKEKNNKEKNIRFTPRFMLAALAAAGAFTLLAWSGLLDKADLAASDALYQQPRAREPYIVLIGIDQKALEKLGPYHQWGRDIMAELLDTLNQSEECRPAAIGIDILYTGNSQAAADERLARAAGKYGNVVTACLAEFGTATVEDSNGDLCLDTESIVYFDEPYESLKQNTRLGHINAMLDADGILRHHLLSLTLPSGITIPSMALALAEKYREFHGLEAVSLPPADSRGFWYLPFCSLPGSFSESISVIDVLDGKRSSDYFAGKIVLIGPYTAGLQDSYFTAIDHAVPMYGMEYQANAVQALMWGDDYKKEVGRRLQLALLFFLLLGAAAGFWKRSVRFSTALWLLLCGGYLFACRLLYSAGWVFHVLWIPIGTTLFYAGCLAFNYILAALEKRKVTAYFKKYVAPEIVNEILREGEASLQPGGKETRIAVLFVDVRGFTSMSEKLAPQQVVDVLNRYLTLISECILNNGGTLDKFIGDAAMAFWGAPLPQNDYIMKAVQAAADMASGSAALAQELERECGRTVSFGIGIHEGPAVVGNIGSSRRMDYTAIGDTVNTAERLEANAKGGNIYISRTVAQALEGRIRVSPLGKIPLKGKAEGFEVFRMEEIL